MNKLLLAELEIVANGRTLVTDMEQPYLGMVVTDDGETLLLLLEFDGVCDLSNGEVSLFRGESADCLQYLKDLELM